MSARQREIKARIEAVLAARNRGDWDALFAEIDPDAEWEPIAETVIYRGREAITEYFARWDEAWAKFRIDAERLDPRRCSRWVRPPCLLGTGCGTGGGMLRRDLTRGDLPALRRATRRQQARSVSVPPLPRYKFRAQSRRTNFCTLPVEVLGKSRNTTVRGIL